MLTVPDEELKDIQRRIKEVVLDAFPLSPDVHGGVRGGSPKSNAAQHLDQPCLVNLDVRKFFPHVRHYVVLEMFRREFGFGRDVARILTQLTTFKSRLPQGAPTSTAIANLLLAGPVDGPISQSAKHHDVRYTRFVDDIALSGTNPRPVINVVARMLSRRRLPMHRESGKFEPKSKPKLKITSGAKAQEVTGLTVNSPNGPSVSRKKRDRIRASIFGLRCKTNKQERASAVASIRGKIAYVRQFNPGAAKRLAGYLAARLV
jgi:hypothetical protein